MFTIHTLHLGYVYNPYIIVKKLLDYVPYITLEKLLGKVSNPYIKIKQKLA